jgi:hypothetical protein
MSEITIFEQQKKTCLKDFTKYDKSIALLVMKVLIDIHTKVSKVPRAFDFVPADSKVK